MSLQVWLPLNGSINQQGLSSIILNEYPSEGKGVNNWDSNGKIGKCAKFTSEDGTPKNYLYNTSKEFNYTKNFSFALWLNFDKNNPQSGQRYAFTVGRADYGGYGYGLSVYCNNSSLGTITAKFGQGSYSVEVPSETWNHIVLTVSESYVKLYLNGFLVNTWGLPVLPTYSDGNGLGIGCFRHSGSIYQFNGKINDFRIYNHVLSLTEVRDISKGLVAHYPLKDPYIEATTNIATSQNYDIRSKSTWGGHTYWSERISSDGTPCPSPQIDHFILQYSGSGGGGGSVYNKGYTIKPNTTYCYSTYIKASDNMNYIHGNFLYRYEYNNGAYVTEAGLATKSKMISLGNGWYRLWNTFKSNASSNSVTLCFYTYPCKSVEYWLACPQLEEKDHLTPYVLGSRDEVSIEDVSGNEYNGIKYNNILPSSNSIRNQYSYLFNGSNTYIDCHRYAMITDQITVSWWGYMDNWSNYTRAISCTCGGGWNFENGSSKMSFPCFINGGYKVVYDSILLTNVLSGWHLFCATYNGKDLKIYRDGQLTGTNHVSDNSLPIQYAGGNSILIGAEASGSPAPAGSYFKGNISDVRIYATALSDEDILKLYQSPVKISKNGTLITNGEFVESTSKLQINKTGVIESDSIVDNANKTMFKKNNTIKTNNIIEN